MNETYAQLLSQVSGDPHAMAKALAHFLFREVVEDIHSEGKITDAEMKQLNKTALNRASYFTEHVLTSPDMKNAFKIEAILCTGWDDPEMTEDLIKKDEIYTKMAGDLMVERLNKKKQTTKQNNSKR